MVRFEIRLRVGFVLKELHKFFGIFGEFLGNFMIYVGLEIS